VILRVMLAACTVVVAGCGHSARLEAEDLGGSLPRVVGDLNELCTKVHSEWARPRFQRTRLVRLRQTRALTRAVRRSPRAMVDAGFIEADTGEVVRVRWTVRRLAREQLTTFDHGGDYCRTRATPRAAARSALRAVGELRAAARS
jgi:hypothetical protein